MLVKFAKRISNILFHLELSGETQPQCLAFPNACKHHKPVGTKQAGEEDARLPERTTEAGLTTSHFPRTHKVNAF